MILADEGNKHSLQHKVSIKFDRSTFWSSERLENYSKTFPMFLGRNINLRFLLLGRFLGEDPSKTLPFLGLQKI